MNILVIGSGGREHAVIKALSQSSQKHLIFAAPGNAGMAQQATCVQIEIKNHSAVVQFCKINAVHLVFIGPEDPLVDGLADSLRENNILVFGPSKEAAQLEASKIFAKDFMQQARVPTAPASLVDSVESTLAAAAQYTAPYILKADGLAAGKGVFICADLNELKTASENLFEKKMLGDAGRRALLEQNLPGKEISFLILTNGSDFQALPLAQDHKRLKDNNQGPNTGGMGTVAPMFIDNTLLEKILNQIVKPSVENLKKHNYLFRGVLFIGIMVVQDQPYVLEYNVRFGDPETQVILPLIENDVAQLFESLAEGHLEKIIFNKKNSFCIVNAAAGYPDSPVKNTPIKLPSDINDSYILHAGTQKNTQDHLLSNGGRVLNIVAIAESFEEARQKAYELNSKIIFEGRQFRTDIGKYQ
jgi:phosphoribosylamine---glycine ligase